MATEDRKPPVPTEESPPKTPPEEAERTRIITPPPPPEAERTRIIPPPPAKETPPADDSELTRPIRIEEGRTIGITPPPLPADSDTPTRAIPRVQQPQSWDAMTVPMARQTPPPAAPPAKPKRKRRPIAWTSLFFGLAATVVGLFFVALLASMIGYIYIASELPPVEELRSRQLTFASSRIYDRDGRLLYEMIDPTGGRRTYVHYGDISPYVIQATIATEDRNFFQHPGFDPIAIARAIYYALQEQEVVSGASTITQQVARNLLLEPEERVEQTVSRKIREIVLAAEITRRYSREEILEIYLNNINYGNLAYGIDAAARTYFGATADNLTLAQASFLAGIPQLPATYDPFGGGREAALTRHENVLRLMVEDGHITAAQAQAATEEMRAHEFRPIFTDRIPAAHFVVYVRQWVEENLGPELLYQGNGLRIHTTLDQQMQAIGEEEVANGVARLAERNVSNGSLVAIEPATGYILAMVGSVDFYNNEIGGQVNVNLRCRQPGSAIKPLTYLGAFEQGWTPATILWDLPVTYTDTAGNIYEPLNYDRQFRGPVSLRSALANSLNVPAVKTLEFIGVNELLDISARLGATSIVSPQLECPEYPLTSRPLYGLALTLGGGEMKPLELTAAYATFANGGEAFAPTPILWIEDSEGRILVDNRVRTGEQVISPQDAYLITDILSDTEARCLVFSCSNILELPDRPVAAKTGTTNDFRDAWTVGYTPDLAVGVWVGNNDNTPMSQVPGGAGAAPIWRAFMERALANTPPHPFPRPPGIVERDICARSGSLLSAAPHCPSEARARELFSSSAPELPPDWVQTVLIDQPSGLRANEACPYNNEARLMVVLDNVTDPAGQNWLRNWAAQQQLPIAPTEYCAAADAPPPNLAITYPQAGQDVYGMIDIIGTVQIYEFDRYTVTYGIGEQPQGWDWVSGPHLSEVENGHLASWSTAGLTPGVYTLRIVASNDRGAQFDTEVRVNVVGPTPTPTLEVTETPTPTPTFTPTPTPLPATDTPTPTPTPPDSPLPTPTLEATPTP